MSPGITPPQHMVKVLLPENLHLAWREGPSATVTKAAEAKTTPGPRDAGGGWYGGWTSWASDQTAVSEAASIGWALICALSGMPHYAKPRCSSLACLLGNRSTEDRPSLKLSAWYWGSGNQGLEGKRAGLKPST